MTLAGKARFVGCWRCREVRPLPSGDAGCLAVAWDAAVADRDEFFDRHGAHPIAEFVRHGSALVADRPLFDPLARITFEITDGVRVYLVTGERSCIDEPRVYRFSEGRLTEAPTAVDVDAHDVERALDLAFHPHALRRTKVKHVVAVLRDLLRHATPDDLDLDDAFDDVADPAVSITPLPEPLCAELIRRCAEIFDPWELGRVRHFLQVQRGGGGVLALRVRRQLTVAAA